MVRNEFNSYKKTIMQEHLYEMIFNEAKTEPNEKNFGSPITKFESDLANDLKELSKEDLLLEVQGLINTF